MPQLIAATLRWLSHKLGLLLLILGVLLAGGWLKAEWSQLRAIQQEIATKDTLLEGLRDDLAALDVAIDADAAAWRGQMAAAAANIERELAAVDERLARVEPKWEAALARFADLERQAAAARRAADRAGAQAARLQRQTWFWDRYLNPQKFAALETARARQAALEANARAWAAARDRTAPRLQASPVAPLQAERRQLLGAIADLASAESPRHGELVASRERKADEVAAVEGLLTVQRERVAADPRQRLVAAVRSRLPLALAILAAVLLAPLAIRTFLYFVLAPAAGRLAPIRILPADTPPELPEPYPSAVSVAIDIGPGEELLVQPGFLQSSSQPAVKRTQWLLNARLPIASLASGLFALTRIRPAGDEPTRVVVSPQRDALGEVGVIELPAGAALVLQPRALAGIVKAAGTPVHITRHWRLASLHAWLTLQLRYLVFHGPCRLVLKGCRGVRAEAPRPGQPRLINQSATLGFSANLDYRTVRCETFVPYLRGQEGLFNDLFAGGPGRFVYEEMPGGSRRGGVTGRGLEGLVDAVLKAFGI
jgi:uncharacterized protein (AIM24 family)